MAKVSYVYGIHIPMIQSEDPSVALVRLEKGQPATVIRVSSPRSGRDFHEDIMAYVARLAAQVALIDGSSHILADLVFSGDAYTPDAYDALLKDVWPWDAYSIITVNPGMGSGRLVESMSNDRRHPINRFIVPRGALISTMNLAYAQPGNVVMALEPEDLAELSKQMTEFSKRPLTQSTNDPDKIMFYSGEQHIHSLATVLWKIFNARAALSQWTRQII